MVGGQVLDTLHAPHTREELFLVNRLKTGAMICGAAEIGCAAAGADDTLRNAAKRYAEEIGRRSRFRMICWMWRAT
jgi:geranylgeranyl diphosphate synthase type II